MRARWTLISVFYMVEMMVWVWTRNKDLGNAWHVLSLQQPWYQVIRGASDWWQNPGCSIRGWESAHFLFLHWQSHPEDRTKPDRCALVWACLVIFFSPSISLEDYLSGLLMDCCIEVLVCFIFQILCMTQIANKQEQTAAVRWYIPGNKIVPVVITF